MAKNVREAKKLLDKYGLKQIKPLQLTQAASQLNKSLMETLRLIAQLKAGGPNQSPFPHTEQALRGKHA